MIFTGFSPNLTARDVRTALSFLLLPWRWPRLRQGSSVARSEERLSEYFKTPALVFDSGRSALYFGLKALGVWEGDEVIVQSYTCVVVSNAVRFTGARPVYADVRDDFNMDPDDLRRKITDKTKAVVVQHTFGAPADLDSLSAIAREHNLKVIEDAAHSFGVKYKGRLTGTYGDIGMYSFGSDKVLSSVRGGALTVRDPDLLARLKEYQKGLADMPVSVLIQHLLHLPLFWCGKKLYGIGVGKWLLYLAKMLHVTNRIIYPAEKKGQAVDFFPSRFPNALATIFQAQLLDLQEVNNHRRKLADLYRRQITTRLVTHPPESPDSCYLRYTLRSSERSGIMAALRAKGILLGDWYTAVIAPGDSDARTAGYVPGSCPNAERLAAESFNLPTDRNISEEQVRTICSHINTYGT